VTKLSSNEIETANRGEATSLLIRSGSAIGARFELLLSAGGAAQEHRGIHPQPASPTGRRRARERERAEQEAFELVAYGNTSGVTAAILARLMELGLVENKQTGPGISRAGLQFLAARGIAPRPWGRHRP
jgi:hypothetical protein